MPANKRVNTLKQLSMDIPEAFNKTALKTSNKCFWGRHTFDHIKKKKLEVLNVHLLCLAGLNLKMCDPLVLGV